MIMLVTSEGRITPALIVVFPVLKFTTAILANLSTSQIEPGTTISFQQMGAWRMRRGKWSSRWTDLRKETMVTWRRTIVQPWMVQLSREGAHSHLLLS